MHRHPFCLKYKFFQNMLIDRIAGPDAAAGNGELSTLHGGDHASGLGDKESSGGKVPWGKTELKEDIIASCRHIAEIQCRGTHAAKIA